MTEKKPYIFELEKLEKILAKEKPRKVLIQIPDGLKKPFYSVLDFLKGKYGSTEFIISSDPAYGACFLAENEAQNLNVDFLVHVGHTEYYKPAFSNVVYVNAYSTLKPSIETLKALASYIKDRGIVNVGLSYVIQHKPIIHYVKSVLEGEGLRVFIGEKAGYVKYDGQVIGCDYSTALKVNNSVDVHVIVCGGYFHAIGLGLATMKPVIKLDPYTNSFEDLTKTVKRYLSIRYAKIMETLDAKKYGIVVGARKGQYRSELAKLLSKLIKSKGLEYEVFSADILTASVLRNIDRSDIDAYIVTSCPRLPIDDLGEFEKPVLTPGEAIMVLTGNISQYRFPW